MNLREIEQWCDEAEALTRDAIRVYVWTRERAGFPVDVEFLMSMLWTGGGK